MSLVVVPNYLDKQIYAAIDKALNGRPCDQPSREMIYQQILAYFDEHGVIPDFSLTAIEKE